MHKVVKVFDEMEMTQAELDFINTYVKNETKPMKTLMKIYMRYWKQLLLSMFFYIIKTSPVLVLPIITANVINIVAAGGGFNTDMIINLSVAVALLIINIPTTILSTKYYSIALRKVEAGLRGAMVRKLQQLSIRFHNEMQSGRIQSKLMRDVETVHMLSFQLFSSIPGIILNIITALAVVVTRDLTVFAFFLLCIPTAALVVNIFRNNIKRTNKEYRINMEETNVGIVDMVEMTPITKAHALEEKEISKMNERLNVVATTGFKLDMVQALFGSCSWAVFQVFQVICLAFSAFLAIRGEIEIGDITLYQTYFITLTNQVSTIISMLPVITKGMESVSSIGEILGAKDVEDYTGKTKLTEVKGEFVFKDLSFSYDEGKSVLKDFNLRVESGETVAFVGESGSGKTTLINLIIGFVKPLSGNLFIDGTEIKDLDMRSFREHIAIVPQNSVLFTGSIKDNITYGLKKFTDEEYEKAIESAYLKDFIESLPLKSDTIIGEKGSNLSGGQRQRISIARAIIRNPEIIIFDEATSALDSVSEREIQNAINNLTKDRTTFIVAHRLSTIRNADKIAVIKDGACVELGTYKELIDKKGEFYRMQNA